MKRDRSSRPRVLPFALCLSLLAACASTGGGTSRAAPIETQRQLPPFSSVELSGPVRAELEVGKELDVRIEADSKTQDELATEVVGSKLVVRLAGRSGGDPRAVLRISLPHLAALTCRAGAVASATGLTGVRVEFHAEGIAVVSAAGAVGHLMARVDGPGRLDLERLSVRNADVHVRGAGEALVSVSGALNATVEGDGDVLYRGDPIVFADTSGAGRVSPRR